MFILCSYLRCKVTKSKFGNVGFCRFLSVFVSFCRFSERCIFSLQSYEKGFCRCQFVSVYVTLCHFPIHNLFHVAKLRKGNLALSPFVTICHLLSPFSKLLFLVAKLRKEKLALSAFVRICPEMSAFVRFRHSNVSYCRCKVTKKYFGIVTLVSPYA